MEKEAGSAPPPQPPGEPRHREAQEVGAPLAPVRVLAAVGASKSRAIGEAAEVSPAASAACVVVAEFAFF